MDTWLVHTSFGTAHTRRMASSTNTSRTPHRLTPGQHRDITTNQTKTQTKPHYNRAGRAGAMDAPKSERQELASRNTPLTISGPYPPPSPFRVTRVEALLVEIMIEIEFLQTSSLLGPPLCHLPLTLLTAE